MEKVVVVDFEGNGSIPVDIVELAFVAVVEWQSIGQCHCWLFKPSAPISRFATDVHGITDGDVAGCPSFDDVSRQVRSLVEGAVIIGHNTAGDVKALQRRMPTWRPKRVLDTLRLAKRLEPGLGSYSLHGLATSFDIQVPASPGRAGRPHSAEYDAALTAQLFLWLLNRHRSIGFQRILEYATIRQFDTALLPFMY